MTLKDGLSLLASVVVLLSLVGMFAYASIYPEQELDKDFTQYAVVFSPGMSDLEIFDKIMRSGGRPIRHATFDFIVIVASDQPNFIKSIKEASAIFVFSPIIKGGCLIQNKSRFRKNKEI